MAQCKREGLRVHRGARKGMKNMDVRRSLLAVTTVVLAFTGAAQAAFPEKPITIIVPFAAGGGNDVAARMLAPLLEKQLGAGSKVEVVNKAGAGGELGFAAIADAAPDGYTVGFVAAPNVVTIPIERQARYTLDKLDLLVCIVDDPSIWTVHADSPYKTLGDLVKQAETSPNTITVGTAGVGSDDHLTMLRMQQLTKGKFVHVPFPGGEAAQKAMLAQKIVVTAQNLGEGLRARGTEKVRILGIMSDKRSELAPDIPTFKEQGYSIVMSAMRGLAAPKNIPEAVRSKLVDAIDKAAADPEFVAKAQETYQPLRILGPEEFSKEFNEADADFRVLWKEEPWLK